MNDMTPTQAIARHLGAKGARGGWIYVGEKPICQGWFAFEQICRQRGWIVSRSAPLGDFVNWRKVPVSL